MEHGMERKLDRWAGAWHVRFQIIVLHFVVIGSRSYSLSDIICTRLP